MPDTKPGSGPPRRPRTRPGSPRNGMVLPETETMARPADNPDEVLTALPTGLQGSRASGSISQDRPEVEEGTIIKLPVRVRARKSRPSGPPCFRIFIIDSGWSPIADRS